MKFVKIISLNTNLCYEYNLETAFQFQDPGNQIHWFEQELKSIEALDG